MLEYQTDENKFVRPEPVKKDWRNFEVNDVIDAKVRFLLRAVTRFDRGAMLIRTLPAWLAVAERRTRKASGT